MFDFFKEGRGKGNGMRGFSEMLCFCFTGMVRLGFLFFRSVSLFLFESYDFCAGDLGY